jgi:hypothetical protein
VPAAATKIWLPGIGYADVGMASLDRAVQEYDPMLRFGRNEETGQYCVFMVKRGEAPLPVLGFNELPSQDHVMRRLYQSDSVRHGKRLLDDIERHNRDLEKTREAAAVEAEGQLAEAIEWGARQDAATRYSRVFLNPRRRLIGGWS